jgi:hypothetical protein
MRLESRFSSSAFFRDGLLEPRMPRRLVLAWSLVLFVGIACAHANPPVASYIFPAGGQRGKTVDVRVGGLFLHQSCYFEMLGPGVKAPDRIDRTKTAWFEGPLLPLPDSQQAEDYPKDMAGRIEVAADAPLGIRYWRVATSQGATPALKFMVGDLPEIVENESDGDPGPVAVKLPVTINGRIFPRENVDVWTFEAKKGQSITCEVCAARLGSPLDSRLEVLDPKGRRIAENDDYFGADSFLRFTVADDGKYQVKIHDINYRGGQAYVYRLTLTADPYVDHVYPLGGRRGSKTSFTFNGQALPDRPVEIALPADSSSTFIHRLTIGDKVTNPFPLDIDDLPEYREAEPNDKPEQAQRVEVPAILNGRIDKPGDVDYWSFAARKGDVLEIDLRAARLGSPLSGVLVVLDAAGKELARADGLAPGQGDPLLRFTAPAEANYLVRVEERFASRGGPTFAYRLRIDRPSSTPDFRLQFAADALTLNRAGEVKLKITAERLGKFDDAINLEIDGLPKSVTVTGTTIPAKQPAAEITFKADASAAIRPSRLTIRGVAKIGDRTLTRTAVLPAPHATPELDSVLLAVALPTPFTITGVYDMRFAARGTVLHRKYHIERSGFTGPIDVSLADRQMRHLQGVTGPTITVPADANEFDYAVTLPPWMETGRTSRTCVMGVGIIKDADGSEHKVSFSSVGQNEQIVAVVEPGRLGLSVEPESIRAAPDKTVTVSVRVARAKGMEGPVKVELVLSAHVHGIHAEPVTIAADKSTAEVAVRFAVDAKVPFDCRAVLRATLLEKGDPVVAESSLAILPSR